MKTWNYIPLLLLLSWSLAGNGQEGKHYVPQYAFGLSYSSGQILKHSEAITTLDNYQTQTLFIDFYHQSSPNHKWANAQRFPKIGATIAYSNYQSTFVKQTGGLLAFAENSIQLGHSPLRFHYHLGVGVGYASRVYDPLENPRNKSMSTHFNGAMDLRTGLSYRAHPSLDLRLNAGLFHLSNGAVKMPNYGINLLQLNMGMKYNFGENVQLPNKPNYPTKSEFAILLNGGSRLIPYTGKRYPIKNLSVEYNLLFGGAHRLGIGMSVMDDAIMQEYQDWANRWSTVHYNHYRWWEVLNMGPYLNYELVFNRFSGYLQAGAYITGAFRKFHATVFTHYWVSHHERSFTKSHIFNRVGFRYRFNHHLMLNVGLNSHLFTARYLEAGIGAYF